MSSNSRFHSIQYIARRAIVTLQRFPYTMVSALVGTAAAIYLVEREGIETSPFAVKLLMVCILGLSLFLALSTLAERSSWSGLVKRAFPALGLVVLAAYFVSLPAFVIRPHEPMVRYLLLLLASHFLVAFLPFLGQGDRTGFWQYNKTLFLRILLANVYFAVLFAGLALALAAVQHLFGLNVDGIRYAQLAIVLVGVFQTWVFLAGIPANLDDLNTADEYPPGLKVFTQFILLPLVALYFLILITYEAKIFSTWNWPEGWVGHLVLWYSAVGILSLLLLHPLQTREGNRWIAAFGNWFFRCLLPLLVMLYFAIYQRIAEYGVTVNRFLVVNMAVGLTLAVLYFVFGRSRDIRAIPVVLFCLAVLSAYGPLSAFSVSERSQRARLAALMTANGILENGAVRKAPSTVNDTDRREMSSIIDYLLEWHGARAFDGWMDAGILTAATRDSSGSSRDSLAALMGFVYEQGWRAVGSESNFYFRARNRHDSALSLQGWTYLIDYSFEGHSDSLRVFAIGRDSCFVTWDSSKASLNLAIGPTRETAGTRSVLELAERIRVLQSSYVESRIDPTSLVFSPDSGSVNCLWTFEHLSGSTKNQHPSIFSMRARVLIGGD